MADLKPIETYYKGYRFRSRLEARWAVFFDYMGIKYEYEYEGFEINFEDGPLRYLPDFWFPEYELFGEVKGVDCRGQIPQKDAEKMSWMIDFGGPCANGIILLGNLPNPYGATTMNWAIWRWMGNGLEYGYLIGDTPKNHDKGLDSIEYGESAPYTFNTNDDLMLTSAAYFQMPNGKTTHGTAVEVALTKARQARFEFGETPNTTRRY